MKTTETRIPRSDLAVVRALKYGTTIARRLRSLPQGLLQVRLFYHSVSHHTNPSPLGVISPSTSSTPARVTPTTTTTPSATPFPIDGGSGDDAPKSKSKAWIAGAVVGPLLGLALIGLLAFFFMRRKKNKSHNQHVAPASGSVPAPGATAYQQNTYPTNVGSPQPPQYYPDMQQNAAAAPFGTGKQDGYYPPGPQSPMTSQGSQSPYGAPQQWQQPGAQPVYNAPSPSMSPAPHNAQPVAAPYNAAQRHFSSELEGSNIHGQAEVINVQPKK
jgi:LPXTG-motif cell wall-anchored protein